MQRHVQGVWSSSSGMSDAIKHQMLATHLVACDQSHFGAPVYQSFHHVPFLFSQMLTSAAFCCGLYGTVSYS